MENENQYENFWDSIKEYLTEKFTDCPASAIEEATATICYKALFLVENQLRERDDMWQKHLDREFKRFEKQMDSVMRQCGIKPRKRTIDENKEGTDDGIQKV